MPAAHFLKRLERKIVSKEEAARIFEKDGYEDLKMEGYVENTIPKA